MTAYSVVQRPADETSSSHNPVAVRFTIKATSEPSVLPRILESFALRNLVPENVSVSKKSNHLDIDLAVVGLSDLEARHLELRMQNILPVLSVGLEFL
jgi:hypothetical protein